MEKLDDLPSEYWTFEDCIDNRIVINQLIDENKKLREAVTHLALLQPGEFAIKGVDKILED